MLESTKMPKAPLCLTVLSRTTLSVELKRLMPVPPLPLVSLARSVTPDVLNRSMPSLVLSEAWLKAMVPPWTENAMRPLLLPVTVLPVTVLPFVLDTEDARVGVAKGDLIVRDAVPP